MSKQDPGTVAVSAGVHNDKGAKQLSKVAGPMLLWGLGVGYVISGDYYGWSTGLGTGGYWGFLVAFGFAFVLYACLCGTIGELAGAIPHSGGPYAFTRTALGKAGGYLCGVGVLIEYVVAPVAVATAFGGYVKVFLPGVPILVSVVILYVVSCGIHLLGAGSSLKVELTLTVIATIMLLVFYAAAFGHVSMDNINAFSGGSVNVFPHGFGGLWATLPFAAWFFLAIEGLPMAAEESRNPTKDMPRALIASFLTLAVLGLVTLTITAGIADTSVADEAAPLPAAVHAAFGKGSALATVLGVVGLAGLAASFHGIVMAYSRQTFALARQGFFPSYLAKVSARHTPTWSLIVPSVIGIVLAAIGQTGAGSAAIPILLNTSVFGAAITYILMTVSALVLRAKRPDRARPFKVPGGKATMWVGLIMSCILLPAGVWSDWRTPAVGALVFALFAAYYFFVSAKRVPDMSVEEELRQMADAEAQLR